jgi:hypothetical protein
MVHACTATLPRSSRDRSALCDLATLDEHRGVLTGGQRVTLRALTERSKLAHDLVTAFADRYATFPVKVVDVQEWDLAAMRSLLARHGIADPTTGRHPGAFTGPGTRSDYRRLLARGGTGLAAALDVTARLASETIVAMTAALSGLTARDVRHVYLHVLTGARQQVRLLQAWSDSQRVVGGNGWAGPAGPGPTQLNGISVVVPAPPPARGGGPGSE